MAAPAALEGRVHIALDDPTLEWEPEWTRLDSTPNLVASYTISRGRQYELERTDTGRAVVQITDRDGLLDPTNAGGPYYGKLEPLLQVALCRWNPAAEEWQWRFRGFIEDFDYVFDPSQRVNRLTISLVSLFEVLAAIHMTPDSFGDVPPDESVGQVFFESANVDDRIIQLYGNAGIPSDWTVTFSGNVVVQQTVYSPGESPLSAIFEAADAELPGVGNVYDDRFGRQAFHGRFAKLDPVTVAGSAENWDFQDWQAGDGAAVALSPSDTAHVRRFAFNRGLSKVINHALAYPVGAADEDIADQVVADGVRIAKNGYRSQSWPNLITEQSLVDSADALVETKRYAEFWVQNYKVPQDRITEIVFRSMRLDHPGAAANWRLLCEADIADRVAVTVGSPGGGGFSGERFFIEGIHEENRPLNDVMDDVTVRLDLSPEPSFDPWEGL